MSNIQPTSKQDIKNTIVELDRVTLLVGNLLKQQNDLIGKIGMTFSQDFKEFYTTAGYMQSVNEQFNKGSFELVKLYNDLVALRDAIKPNIDNHHWEDLEDPYYKPSTHDYSNF